MLPAIKALAMSEGAREKQDARRITYESEVDLTQIKASHTFPTAPIKSALNLYLKRFSLPTEELELALENPPGLYERSVMFENNFIRVYGTELMLAVWRYMAVPFTRIDVEIHRVTARYSVPRNRATATTATSDTSTSGESKLPGDTSGTPSAAPGVTSEAPGDTGPSPCVSPPYVPSGPVSPADLVAAAAAAQAEGGQAVLEVASTQHWHIPRILPLVRLVFGATMRVEVVSSLEFSGRGRVAWQRDFVANWLSAPMPLRFLFGLSTPAVNTLIG